MRLLRTVRSSWRDHARPNCIEYALSISFQDACGGLRGQLAASGTTILGDSSIVNGTQRRAASSSAVAAEDQTRLAIVLPYLEGILSSLSIPHGELRQLNATGLSNAALTAWALTKTASHPAVAEAGGAAAALQALLRKLDAGVTWKRRARASPLGQLLWQVAVAADCERLGVLEAEQLAANLNFQVLSAQQRALGGSLDMRAVMELAPQQLPCLTDAQLAAVLAQPSFWRLAQSAATSAPGLSDELGLLGYNLEGCVAAYNTQAAVLLAATGMQPQEASAAAAGGTTLMAGLAALLGLTTQQLPGAAPSACELVSRLMGVEVPTHELGEPLREQLTAVLPHLRALSQQLNNADAAAQPAAAVLALLQSTPETQLLAASLIAWRADAAGAGWLPVILSLTQSEVAALTQDQAQGLASAVMKLEASGRLLFRRAEAQALPLGQLSCDDAAALAWKLHTAGTQGGSAQLCEMLLAQAEHRYAQCTQSVETAQQALQDMAAGFALEDATSRRSSVAPPSRLVLAGLPQRHVQELLRVSPVLPGASDGAGDAPSAGEALVRDLAALLATDAPGSQQGGAAAAARLAAAAHDLPSRLSGPLLELLELMREDASCDAAVAARQQGLLRAFVQALQAELPRLAPERRGASGSGWAAAPPAGGSVGGAEAAGLLELLGEQDAAGVLAHAAAATSRGGAGDEREGIFSMLSDIHSQGSVQRYLSLEMDPALALDVTDVPGGWRGAELPPEPGAFLDGMRPLLDTYLTAQGERPLHDSEWQVYREAALTEAEGQELEDAAQRRAAGHSPFCNSRADEAYLLQRLRAGISQDSVLYAAAHKYLAAACRNRTWRFAQRRRLVDRLIAIAGHLAAHPPRTHRGSPFSALFQPDGPPLAPRLPRGGSTGKDESPVGLSTGQLTGAPL